MPAREPPVESADLKVQYDCVLRMAQPYGTYGCRGYKDKALLEDIVFAIYKIYGGGAVNGQGVIENYPYGAFCTQILHLNTRTFARVINFSDANRGTVTAVGAWSQVKVASVAEWNSAQQRITAVEGSLGSPGDGDDPLKNTAWAWIEELGWRTDGHDQTLAEYEARLQALEQRAGINNQ